MAILGIDFGRRRIGLAIADSLESPALPLITVDRASLRRDLDRIGAAIRSRGVHQIVVGLPLNMDGSEGPMARAARNFGARLGAHLGLPVDYADERLSSFEARERLKDAAVGQYRKTPIDAMAATLILEEWLATHRNPS